MASSVDRLTKQAVRRVPSPLLRWTLRLGVKLLLPLAGAAATAGAQRLRERFGHGDLRDNGPAGTVTVEINRELRDIAPSAENPAEPLRVLAERADLTLTRVPGSSVTCLRAVPKRAGDDIRPDVLLAKRMLEP
ncbi:hypothetical protein GCM10009839_08560 [Catenulispora yoronensis]|uniref:Uncharacterized protein n=1 Tax=Catenulispora yoronensis TaxID=450799 RepID=A0ABP5F377_9ACTN